MYGLRALRTRQGYRFKPGPVSGSLRSRSGCPVLSSITSKNSCYILDASSSRRRTSLGSYTLFVYNSWIWDPFLWHIQYSMYINCLQPPILIALVTYGHVFNPIYSLLKKHWSAMT
ncbi:hypothetical protein C0J52_10222 [Blattella germanica]|nr:hypothetical protein C0J52_10222 [Blattella germanica]